MSKLAVVRAGHSQFIVKQDDVIEIDHQPEKKTIDLPILAIIDGENTKVGTPTVSGSSVKATVVEETLKADKVIAIRYKAKKGVHKTRGHRQRQTRIKITSIS